MPGLYATKENNYFETPKESRIFTSPVLTNRIYEIIEEDYITEDCRILDVCSGEWNLTERFSRNESKVMVTGVDIVEPEYLYDNFKFHKENYLEKDFEHLQVDLILCNPPFNNNTGTRKLLPFLFLKKVLKEFPDKPLVLFAPHGLFNNNDLYTTSYKEKCTTDDIPRYEWLRENVDKLSSMMFIPKDIFSLNNRYIGIVKKKRKDKITGEEIVVEEEKEKGVLVHSCITFWNMKKLKPFYTF